MLFMASLQIRWILSFPCRSSPCAQKPDEEPRADHRANLISAAIRRWRQKKQCSGIRGKTFGG